MATKLTKEDSSLRDKIMGATLLVALCIAYLMRPSFMGIQIPVEVMFSGKSADWIFASQLYTHFGAAAACGIAVGYVIDIILRSRKSGSAA